ncbi:hypothetical protein GN956_G1311 [Arapaima gigas]
MSHLLGHPDCVENLRIDLTDLQGAVLDVFSCTGPVRCPSWKFPDQLSCNVDLLSLLQHYDFVDGEKEFNQYTHVVLLELIIDRLMLLLQSFNTHVELMLGIQKSKSQTQPAISLVSIGLVVKNYWRNLVDLYGVHRQLQEGRDKIVNSHSSARKGSEQLEVNGRVKKEDLSSSSLLCNENTINQQPPSSVSKMSSRLGSCSSSQLRCVSMDMRSVGCQTVASSLVPCDACARVQKSFRSLSDALVAMCQDQGLPSSLGCFLAAVDDSLEQGQLSAADIAQWAAEQSRDLGRLGKYLSQLRDTINPLKENQVVLEGQRTELKVQVKRIEELLAQEREKNCVSIENLKFRLKEAQVREEEAVRKLQSELEKLRQDAVSLKEKNSRLEAELCTQQDNVHTLEHEKIQLLEELQLLQQEQTAKQELEERLHTLEAELSSHKLLLEKENAKYLSVCRQQEAMQAKQKALLERADILDQECEELQERLGASEEARAKLENRLRGATEETNQLQAQLTEQQALITELQEEKTQLRVQVAELQEDVQDLVQREKLLVAFPELSPVARRPPQSTGDILGDMEQQVQANSVRITVLEKENITLRSSLARLRDGVQQADVKQVAPTQQLHSTFAVGTRDVSDCPALNPKSYTQVQRATEPPRVKSSTGLGRASNSTNETGSWHRDFSTASSHSASSTSNQLHFHTLGLHFSPQYDGSKNSINLQHVHRTRSAGLPTRKK